MPRITGILQDLTFCVWLISHSVMSSRPTYTVACFRMSFLRLGDSLVYVYITVCLSIHPVTDTDGSNVASAFWILSIMLLSAWIGKYPSDSLGYIHWDFSFSSVQFSCSVVSDSLRPHEPQHARPPCPSPTPGVHPNPCPSSW